MSLYLNILGVSNFLALYYYYNIVNILGVLVSLSILIIVLNIIRVLDRGSSIISLRNRRV